MGRLCLPDGNKLFKILSETLRRKFAMLIVFSISMPGHVYAESAAVKIGINNIVPSLLKADVNRLIVKNSDLSGLAASLYQCIFDQSFENYQLTMLPVGRLEILLEKGDIDIGALVSQTDGRDHYAEFSEAAFQTEFIVVTKRTIIPEDKRFSGWVLSTALNTVFHDIAEARFDAKLYPTNSWNSALIMLQKERVDGVFLASHIYDHDVDLELKSKIYRHTIEKKPVGLYINRKADASLNLIEKLNESVADCRIKYPMS